jgi:hypothetical protein
MVYAGPLVRACLTYPTESVVTLLGKARQSISNAMGVRFAKGIGSVFLAVTIVYALVFHAFLT